MSFLDEIQAVPPAIQALRYFYEDHPDLPVIAAGSLLEILLSKHSFSMPVGRIEYLFLNPMTFEEVLEAQKQDDLLKLLNEYTPDRAFPESAHSRLLDLQRKYFITGGMPEAVDRFIDTNSFEEVSEVHAAILETYRDDFSKYATQSFLLRMHKIQDYVPGAVGEKLKYVNIDHQEHARELKKALDLLVKARLISLAYHSDASGLPLKAGINWKVFKPFFLDCGLMNFICGVRSISLEQLTHRKFVNEGKIAEQFIAQHLVAIERPNISPELFYWLREVKSAITEVDFMMQSEHEILPIEVKSGKSGTLKSLHQFVYRKNSSRAFRFDLNKPAVQAVQVTLRTRKESVAVEFDLFSLPLFLIEQINRFVDQSI
ncbi:MAG: ATP-binding protein [Proteobacteria bacterium]|nr:ATP-binding protein [Pseudomonadota bacterium]